jgi:hypothetical protein
MTVLEQEWLRLSPSPASGARKFRVLALLGAGVFLAYAAATIGGAPRSTLSLVFSAVMLPVPFAVWWAYARAPAALRRPIFLLGLAATLWLLGSLVWEGFSVAAGNQVPRSPGVWDAFFVTARLLVIAALVIAMRSVISFRLAALDASIVVAAGLALAAPFVRQGLEQGATAASLVTLNRPILSIVTLMLIVSAALGSWEGLPLSFGMLGAAEFALTVGNLIYSYSAVQGAYVDDRWADLAWAAGAVMALLASSLIILRIDRLIRLPARTRIPNHPPGSKPVLLLSVGALSLALTVACYGLLIESHGLALVGVVTSVAIGLSMALRARESIRTAEDAYQRLDRALAETERARDELATANEELGRANAEIRAMQIAFADLLNLADERTHGRMRALIEDTGGELAELLEDQIEPKRRR